MDCNRDEALRAKEIAEQKFTAKDFEGAKKFALKAHNLFPTLEGINQMIATLDIYLAGEMKISGENNWYAILCVNASADEEAVRKQYRKLALQLHPDKNKSIGAEGAFKLISEAWSVLSDKGRKTVYDQKINVKRVSQPKRDHPVPNAANGFYNFTGNAPPNKRAQKSAATGVAPSAAPPPSRPLKPKTFWTSCSRCRMQYEYLRVYLNHNLLCPNCHEAFLAIETGFPANGHNSSVSWSAPPQNRQDSNHNSKVNNAYGSRKNPPTVQGVGNTGFQHGANLDSHDNPNFQWGPFSRTAGSASAVASSSAAAQAANVVHQTYEKVRREREETQATARREEAVRRKNHLSKRNTSGFTNPNGGTSGNVPDSVPKVDKPAKKRRSIGDGAGNFGGNETAAPGYKMNSGDQCFNSNMSYEMGRANGVSVEFGKVRGTYRQNNFSREFPQMDFRNMLIEKTKVAIYKKLEEWNSAAAAQLAEEEEKAKKKQKCKVHDNAKAAATVAGDAGDPNKLDDSRTSNKRIPIKKDFFDESTSDSNKVVVQLVSINVPDPDFHDFDKDRSEGCFESDQIWATYDNEDGMPRFYAFVQKVITSKPFKMRMSFLNAKSNSELGPLNWVASGFAKTCGDFRVGRYVVNDTVNIFSHMVKWEKGTRGVIRIVPREGDTWALYRNWSPNWNERTPDDVIFKYDMVEVLDDYNDEQGVSVTPLVKVAGFKTVFHRHLDPKEVKRIPREEMFRFSHQVPSHLLTGEEAHNAPKGCRELDPAATPLELLQIITEANEEEMMETAEQQPVS